MHSSEKWTQFGREAQKLPGFSYFQKKYQKNQNIFKKGVDKGKVVWYYNQALAREGPERVLRRAENLENDTEIRGKTTVNSGMSFNLGLVKNQ